MSGRISNNLLHDFINNAEELSSELFRCKNINIAYEKIAEIITDEKVKEVGCAGEGYTKGLLKFLHNKGIKVLNEGSPKELAGLNIGITSAEVGIADTGSLGVIQSDYYPRLFSTLPPVNIMILESSKIVKDKFEATKEMTKEGMPGYFVYISGPSRTADIERVLTLGVHGPKRLIIMLVDKEVV